MSDTPILISIYSRNSNFKLFQRFLGKLVLNSDTNLNNNTKKRSFFFKKNKKNKNNINTHEDNNLDKKTHKKGKKRGFLSKIRGKNRNEKVKYEISNEKIETKIENNYDIEHYEGKYYLSLYKNLEFMAFHENEKYYCENTNDYDGDLDQSIVYSIGRSDMYNDFISIQFNNSIIKYRYLSIGNPKGLSMCVDTYRKIEIICDTQDTLDRLMKECYKFKFYSRDENSVNIFKWYDGYWDKYSTIEKRPLDSIYLEEKIKDKVVNDVKQFTKNKEKYKNFGIPYKRNYLFSGLPGTGKTSFITSIASELGYSLYIIPFINGLNDSTFTEALKNIPDKSILLMEDVDILFKERDRISTELSFSGMINALDGLTKKTGLLTFLTTNFIEKLDDALIRPGRIDLHIKFSYIVDEQKRMMCKRFIPFMNDDEINQFIESTKRIKMTTAILQQFLFHNDNEDINKRKKINELEKLAKKYIKKDNTGHMYN